MAGLMLVAAGFLRLGTFIKYIPYPVVTGFTSGIARHHLLKPDRRSCSGLSLSHVPGDVLGKWQSYPSRPSVHFRWQAVAVAGWYARGHRGGCSVSRRACAAFLMVDRLRIAIRVHSAFPCRNNRNAFRRHSQHAAGAALAGFTLAEMREFFPSAFTIFVLGGIESLLSAVVADGMTGGATAPMANWWRRESRTSPAPAWAAFLRPARSRARRRIFAAGAKTPVAGDRSFAGDARHDDAARAIGVVHSAGGAWRACSSSCAGIWRRSVRQRRSAPAPMRDRAVLMLTIGRPNWSHLSIAIGPAW